MKYQRIVIKIGTSTLTGGGAKIQMPKVIDLVRQLCALKDRGADVLLVTSGAVAAGRELLEYPVLSKHVPRKQMLSSIGQPRLMSMYMDLFSMYGSVAAQVLLTRSDLVHRMGYLNARNTIELLLQQGVVPVINENDTIATDEIRLGDNDTLSAHIAGLIGADLLILMTDLDGLYDADPRTNPDANFVSVVDGTEIPEKIWQSAGGSKTDLGTGGMLTKIRAADIARRMGTIVKIVNGAQPDCLLQIADGASFGTTFIATNTVLESRKRYLISGFRADGSGIVVDDGACSAIERGKSLLPAGVTDVRGTFERGDTVRILRLDGSEIGIGMANYSREDLLKIHGKQAEDIESVLGYSFGDEVVHHDNMIFDREGNGA